MTSSTISDSGVGAPPSIPVSAQASVLQSPSSAQSVGAAQTAAVTQSPRPSRTMSILAMSLGIASIFFAQSIVVPVAAIILGVFGLRDEPSGRNFSIWGIVLACVAMFGWIFVLLAGAIVAFPFFLLSGAF